MQDALSVDLTANPDFSQVESDEPQVTINQRFEVFFPEKRPFFLENAGYFQTPINLFFSRRIRDPQIGARATGKVGGWAAGALVIDDRAPGSQVAEDDPLRDDRAVNGVVARAARVRRVAASAPSSPAGTSALRSTGSPSADTRLKLNKRMVPSTGRRSSATPSRSTATTATTRPFRPR